MFIDSLQFMNASLEKLVSNLAKEGDAKFRVLKKYVPFEKVPFLLRKGVYPYEYVDGFEKFQDTNLRRRFSALYVMRVLVKKIIHMHKVCLSSLSVKH